MPPTYCKCQIVCRIGVVTAALVFLEGSFALRIYTYSFWVDNVSVPHVSLLSYRGRAITLPLFVLLLLAACHSGPLFGCSHVLPSLRRLQDLRLHPASER